MMRIAFLAWQGAEHTRRWAGFFAERGHDVHVITCGDGDAASVSYAVHDLGPPRLGRLGYLTKSVAARRLLRSLGPDVVHAHHATSYGFLGAVAGAHPLVVTSHGSDTLLSGSDPVLRRVVTYVLRRADLITAPEMHVAAAIEALAGPSVRTRLAVFQYGVEVARLAALGSEARARTSVGGPLRLVTARPLTALYRTDAVVKSVALLLGSGRTCVLDVVGDGPERDALAGLVRRLGLGSCVRFHGLVAEEEAERLIANADVYVSVAESDGASIALLEAMAIGTIPVVRDIEANRAWVVDGVGGVLTTGAPDAIADAIRKALELDHHAVRSANLEIVRRRADRETNLRRCEQMLLDLVAGRPPLPSPSSSAQEAECPREP